MDPRAQLKAALLAAATLDALGCVYYDALPATKVPAQLLVPFPVFRTIPESEWVVEFKPDKDVNMDRYDEW